MSKNDHTPAISELFRRMAIDNGYLITPEQEPHLIFVNDQKLRELKIRLSVRVGSLHSEDNQIIVRLVSELSEFLSTETGRRLKRDLQKFLKSLFSDLHLSDVKTEVLASWLAEIETCNSSFQNNKNCHPELPTPDGTKTVIPDGGSVTLHGSGGEVRA